MKSWQLLTLIIIVISFAAVLLFPRVLNTTALRLDTSHSALENYIVYLETQRERCYNHIILLGTQNERQLQLLKIELYDYLNALINIQSTIKYDNLIDSELNTSIELDRNFIEQTIDAIETKDEQLLVNISEIYYELLEYQRLLRLEIAGNFSY